MTFFEIMLMSAALSAKDSSAVGNMIDHHCLLDLHSIIFGEGVFNVFYLYLYFFKKFFFMVNSNK